MVADGTGRGVGITSPQASAAPLAGGVLSAGLSWRLTSLVWLHAGLQGTVLVVQPQFVIEGYGIAYQPPAFVPAASLGVELRFL